MTVPTSLTQSRDVNLYVDYNNPQQVRAQNENDYNPLQATVFPFDLYQGQPQPVSDYICGEYAPRSLATHYIIDREVAQHPDHFARFGYARAFYGYASGHFPGRFQENNYCQKYDPPKDMAPKRFYRAPHVGPFSVASTAYIGSRKAREAWPRWAV